MDYENIGLKSLRRLDPVQMATFDFLSAQKFDTFGTFTTSLPMGLPACRRHAVRFTKAFPKIQSMFWAAEPFDVREGYHFHALIKSNYSRVSFWSWWSREKNYGRSNFLAIHGTGGTEAYMVKYAMKHNSDYDFHFNKP